MAFVRTVILIKEQILLANPAFLSLVINNKSFSKMVRAIAVHSVPHKQLMERIVKDLME